MTLRISGKHMDIGDAFRARIVARIGETIEKYFDGGFSGHVTVVKSGSRYTADCMIHLDSGAALQATGEPRRSTRTFCVGSWSLGLIPQLGCIRCRIPVPAPGPRCEGVPDRVTPAP